MATSDQEISSWILEFLLRQPIPNDLLHLIHLALPLPTLPPPRVLKTLLLRRLAGDLASAIPYQTLETLELIEQLDRDHNLVPSPSAALQLAYSAVSVDLTARFLKEEDGDLGDFFDAVNRVWNCRVGDLEGSEARGLVSGRLREERRVMEEAVVSGVVRGMLRRRETAEEAAGAVRDYLKEAAEKELGPTVLEVEAAAVLGGDGERCDGRDELRVRVGGTEALNEGGCSTSGFSHLPVPEAIQEKNQLKPRDEEHHNMVEEPIIDNVTVADGVSPTVETVEDSDPDRMEEDQSLMDEGQLPSVDNGTEVFHTKDISSVTDHNKVQDTVVQPSIADQNPTELKHGEENQNALDGNVKVSFVDKGAEVTYTRDISSVTDHNRVHETVMQPSIADQNRTELEHGEENQNALDGNVKVSIVYKGKVAVEAECTTNVAVDTEGTSNVAVNTEVTSTLSGKKRDIHAVRVPSIMDRNPTAQTYTWHDDFVESSSEKSPNPSEKIRVLRPKRRIIPVTKIPWNKEFAGRRKKKWWTVDEEDTLRKAVDKYGAGNWVLIKNSYPATFEDRTPIDLKDKWRNMTR